MMSAQSLASFCCSSRKRWCSCASSQSIARCDLRAASASRADACRAAHVVGGDQPPQRRVDAAEVPEVGVAAFGVDVLRDLAVGRLLRGQRVEAGDGAVLERVDAAAAHRQHADRRIAAEDAGVAPRLGGLGAAWPRGCRAASGCARAAPAIHAGASSLDRIGAASLTRRLAGRHADCGSRAPSSAATGNVCAAPRPAAVAQPRASAWRRPSIAIVGPARATPAAAPSPPRARSTAVSPQTSPSGASPTSRPARRRAAVATTTIQPRAVAAREGDDMRGALAAHRRAAGSRRAAASPRARGAAAARAR